MALTSFSSNTFTGLSRDAVVPSPSYVDQLPLLASVVVPRRVLSDRCRSVLLPIYVVEDEVAVPVHNLVYVFFPGHWDQLPLTMKGARPIGALDNLCPRFFTVTDDFDTHGAVHVLDVVEAFVTGGRGFQPPPLVVPAGIGVLLDSSPLSRRLAFHLQNQLTVLINDLDSFVHRHSHGTSSS